MFLPQRKAFLTSGLVVGALFFSCSLVLLFGVKEQPGESPMSDGADGSSESFPIQKYQATRQSENTTHMLTCITFKINFITSRTSQLFPRCVIWVLFPAPVRSDDKARPSYLTSLKMLMRHIPYQRLVLGFVFSALAFQVQKIHPCRIIFNSRFCIFAVTFLYAFQMIMKP